jgi:hypothetical protein
MHTAELAEPPIAAELDDRRAAQADLWPTRTR